MAYFSNGSEGSYYEEKYCNNCVHGVGGQACRVLLLHMEWNYEQQGDSPEAKAKKEALTTLWPREGVHNGQCTMFKEVA